MNTAGGWGLAARLLHWMMAALLIGMLLLGWYMVEVVGTRDLVLRYQLTQWHKSFGFVAFALAVLRLLWRFVNPTPPHPEGALLSERLAARFSHVALYLLMLAVPLSGWLMASASPLNDPGAFPFQMKNMVFGLFEMPDPHPKGDRALEATLKAVHYWSAMALVLAVAAHVSGALVHHLFRRDRILMRMLTGR
jgi:cytochrome b561